MLIPAFIFFWTRDVAVPKHRRSGTAVHTARSVWAITCPDACSSEEVLQALSAALEVNEHLRQQVEEKGNLVQAMTTQLQAYEHRYNELKDRMRELEMHLTENEVAGKGSAMVCARTCFPNGTLLALSPAALAPQPTNSSRRDAPYSFATPNSLNLA